MHCYNYNIVVSIGSGKGEVMGLQPHLILRVLLRILILYHKVFSFADSPTSFSHFPPITGCEQFGKWMISTQCSHISWRFVMMQAKYSRPSLIRTHWDLDMLKSSDD